MFNSLLGKAKEKKEQKLLEKREKYYRSEILPEIRKIVVGDFVVSKIGDAKEIENNGKFNKDELKIICERLIVGISHLNDILRPFSYDLDEFLKTNDDIQKEYIEFVFNKRKDANDFYYQKDSYLVDVFRQTYTSKEEHPLAQSVAELLDKETERQLIDSVNSELKSLRRAEEMILKICVMPKATLQYVCTVKKIETTYV